MMFHKTQQDIMRNWHIGLESNLDCLNSKQNQLTESKANLYNSNQPLKPLCSFLCITYNHIDFIEQCLVGFLEQETTFPFEIIIHDDCSTDGTDRIIKEYQSKYPQIIKAMYEEENQYSKGDKGKPFWAIMHNMAGKYIALCEGDDYWNDIHKIQKQVTFLESNPEFVGCYHRCHTILSDGTMYKEDLGSQYKDISARMLQRLEVGISTRTICYRNVVDYLESTLHYYHYKILNGDTFLWTLLGQHGSIRYMSDINPSYYRLHAGGIWSSLSDKTRFIIHTKSFFYMSEYYSKIGNHTAASFFFQLSLRNLCFASDASLMQDDIDSVIKTLLNKRGGGGQNTFGRVSFIFYEDYFAIALPTLSFLYYFLTREDKETERKIYTNLIFIVVKRFYLLSQLILLIVNSIFYRYLAYITNSIFRLYYSYIKSHFTLTIV